MARPGAFEANIGTGSYHHPGPMKVTGLRYRFKQPPGVFEADIAILLSPWPSAPELSSLYPSFLYLSHLSLPYPRRGDAAPAPAVKAAARTRTRGLSMGSSCSLGSSCRRRAPCRVSSRSSRLRRRGEGASAWGPWRSTTASASSLGPRRRRGSSRPSETVAIQQRQAATGCQARGRTKQSQGEEREHEPGEFLRREDSRASRSTRGLRQSTHGASASSLRGSARDAGQLPQAAGRAAQEARGHGEADPREELVQADRRRTGASHGELIFTISSLSDTLLTGLWTDEPCNADGDFLIVPQKGNLVPLMWHSFGTMIVLL
ncbi:uncharacterized protein LOC120689613 isoform X3 [Panicum virgatum]|uniref:uncharacterized protein LOC120689613 isoform X3 n=1 Tax=Panicum virgatum TaxID=38727 RepID=UPI0019D627D6|nr:uncharacterized protein LOC120689613 isoform X3 [Panicum virgatum]